MSAVRYVNPRSGRMWPVTTPLWRAPDDGGPLELSEGPGMRAADIDRNERSLWRYRAALRTRERVTLGEGWTPLLKLDWHGLEVLAKADHLMPSGSFKDRGTAVMLSYLLECGVEAVTDDTSGNMGASLASYAAAARLGCRIFCPTTTTAEKIAQMHALGADVRLVPGPRDAATEVASSQSDAGFYASHILQPFFLEGTKTVAYEIWEQLGCLAPDAVIAPLGQGGNLLGLHTGFGELLRTGGISKRPRLYGVQARNCAPFDYAVRAGRAASTQMPVLPTIAAGIASARPARLEAVLHAIADSGGAIVTVTEQQIVASLRHFFARGLFIEPTTAVVGAATSLLAEQGALPGDARIVVLLTGHGLKATQTIAELTSV